MVPSTPLPDCGSTQGKDIISVAYPRWKHFLAIHVTTMNGGRCHRGGRVCHEGIGNYQARTTPGSGGHSPIRALGCVGGEQALRESIARSGLVRS